MSDDNNRPNSNTSKTQPIKKTSAVPLRKETVRVTLKAPGAKPSAKITSAVSTAPLQSPNIPAPTIPLGSSMAPAPSAPSAPKAMTPNTTKVSTRVNLPDVTSAVPLKQETMRVTLKADKGGAPSAPSAPAPAPTIPLGNAVSVPRPAVAAPTIPLGAVSPSVPLATAPLTTGANASQPLPKATVQLQQTQQLTQGLGAPSQAATIQTVSDDDDDDKTRSGGASLPLSIIAFVLSLVVIYFCFNHASIWVDKHKDGDTMSVFEGLRDSN